MQPGHGMVLSPTWGPDVSGKSFRTLPRTTYHPDPRRLAENRAVALKVIHPSKEIGSKWGPLWNKVCGAWRHLSSNPTHQA